MFNVGEPNQGRNKKNGVPSSLAGKKAKRPRPLSPDQDQFCYKIVFEGLTIENAGAEIGISNATAWRWKRMERVQKHLQFLTEERAKATAEQGVKAYKISHGFIRRELARVAAMPKPHKFRGYADKVKALMVSAEIEKLVDRTPRNTAVAIAGAHAQSAAIGDTMATRYQALWLMRKERAIVEQLEREEAAAALPAAPPIP